MRAAFALSRPRTPHMNEQQRRNGGSSAALGLKETPMFLDNKPYAIMVIAAFVCFAVLLMLLAFWALYEPNGPSSLDATKKARNPSAARRPPPIARTANAASPAMMKE